MICSRNNTLFLRIFITRLNYNKYRYGGCAKMDYLLPAIYTHVNIYLSSGRDEANHWHCRRCPTTRERRLRVRNICTLLPPLPCPLCVRREYQFMITMGDLNLSSFSSPGPKDITYFSGSGGTRAPLQCVYCTDPNYIYLTISRINTIFQ